MEAVVLNGARSGDEKVDEVSDAMSSALGSLEQVSVFKLREIFIADCSSCFGRSEEHTSELQSLS